MLLILRTVIVWKEFQQAYTLKGHTAAVWAVLALENDLILTGTNNACLTEIDSMFLADIVQR